MRKSRDWGAFCRVRVAERVEVVAVVAEMEICGIEEAARRKLRRPTPACGIPARSASLRRSLAGSCDRLAKSLGSSGATVSFSRSDFSMLGSMPGRNDRAPSPGQRACFMLCIRVIMALVVER